VAGEELLAIVGLCVGELQSGFREPDVAALDLGKAQQLQRFRRAKQVIDLQASFFGDDRQVRLAVIGRLAHRLHETGENVRGDVRESGADAETRKALGLRAGALLAARLGRHLHVHAVHERAKARIERMARLGQIDEDLAHHAPRLGGENQQAVAHLHRLLDVVRHQQHRLDRQLPLAPQVEEVVAQRFGRQHIESGKRSSMSRTFG